MKTKALRLISCRDPSMWYAPLVGEIVPLVRNLPGEGYLSREPAGYTNIVRFEDAEEVEVETLASKGSV